ncbi:MAG: hypothetical protein IVW52_12560 [Acidimicrobiales bacterium]|nr:hypothetical protein [Acidimicrobiales bacterium]
MTPEAADLLVAIWQSDPEDLAMAALVLTATTDALEAGAGTADQKDIEARVDALRRKTDNPSGLDLWRAIARDVVLREKD